MTENRVFRIESAGTRHAGRVRLQGTRKQALETGRNRLLVTGVVFALAFLVIAGRLVELTVGPGATPPRTARATVSEPLAPAITRGDIVDRNGVILATSLPTASLYVDPAEVLDAEEAADKIRTILPEMDRDTLVDRLDGPGRFAWIRRNLTPNQQWRINALGIPGLHFRDSERRTYPHGALVAHVLGLTDIDGHGIAGMEKSFDDSLSGGGTLRLSVDIRLQAMLHEELMGAVETFQAIGAAGVVMDTRSGEVLAMVSLPDFDPNSPATMTPETAFNRASKGVYELGSTFKIFNTAMALDSKVVKLTDRFDTREPIRHAGFTISDFHPEERALTVSEILVHSSNIGSAKMALAMGGEMQRDYLEKLGLLSTPTIELPEVGRPLSPRPWRDINTMTISYGHGIAVSPVQLAGAVSAVVNGGVMEPITLLARADDAPEAGRRVFSPEASRQVGRMMRMVVQDGTGRKAKAEGYRVGGKTGTAEKMIGGRYHAKKLISSFVGAFPMDAPRYVVLVALDEPKGNESTLNYATAGWVAAPSVGRLVARMGPIVGVQPVDVTPPQPVPATPEGRAIMASLDDDTLVIRERRLAAN